MKYILVSEPAPGVGLITLNRPEALNALNDGLMTEVVETLRDWQKTTETRCAIITGSERAFAAGADISLMSGRKAADIMVSGYLDAWDHVAAINIPLIAAVAGHCLGGGCELAQACDIILAAENAKFGQPEIKIGVIPGAGGTQRLARSIGKSRTAELVLTGDPMLADEALQRGLVSRVVPTDELAQAALDLAIKIASMPPLAARMAKDAIRSSFDAPLSEGVKAERRNFLTLFGTEDQSEGMSAFLEKRAPVWTGR